MSSDIAEKLLPSINNTRELNPSVFLTAHVSSHEYPDSEARAIYYNNRFFGGTRNERRITRWGRGSPLQDPENTGALMKWFTEFGHLNRGDMLTSEHYRCLNEKKKFQCRV